MLLILVIEMNFYNNVLETSYLIRCTLTVEMKFGSRLYRSQLNPLQNRRTDRQTRERKSDFQLLKALSRPLSGEAPPDRARQANQDVLQTNEHFYRA